MRHYILFERPPGSKTWTQIIKRDGVPMRFHSRSMAEKFAIRYAANKSTCVRIVPIQLPKYEDRDPYALMIDGDTTYTITQ